MFGVLTASGKSTFAYLLKNPQDFLTHIPGVGISEKLRTRHGADSQLEQALSKLVAINILYVPWLLAQLLSEKRSSYKCSVIPHLGKKRK